MSRTLILALLLVPAGFARVAMDDPDHANHFQGAPIYAGDITASSVSAFARQQEAKLKVEFDNRTDDFLLVSKNGARISMASGEYHATNKDGFEVIKPGKAGSQTYVFEDPSGTLHNLSMTARLSDIYLAPTDAPAVEAESFTLPLQQNEIEASGFTCRSKGKVKQETQETEAKFECSYQGAPGTVGLITSENISFVIPDGQAFANEVGKPMKLLLPGDTITFHVKNTVIKPNPHGVDMQFTELTLRWNDALRVATMQPVTFPDWELTLDVSLTDEKNK